MTCGCGDRPSLRVVHEPYTKSFKQVLDARASIKPRAIPFARWWGAFFDGGVAAVAVDTHVDAPADVLFDLSHDVEVHTRSTGAHEEIVGGVRTGHMTLGDDVTWRARHFGIAWTMTSKITAYDRPHRFIDEQQRGPFACWWHRHGLHPECTGTGMVDQVC